MGRGLPEPAEEGKEAVGARAAQAGGGRGEAGEGVLDPSPFSFIGGVKEEPKQMNQFKSVLPHRGKMLKSVPRTLKRPSLFSLRRIPLYPQQRRYIHAICISSCTVHHAYAQRQWNHKGCGTKHPPHQWFCHHHCTQPYNLIPRPL